MLRRKSSRSSHRRPLGRSKSTSSIARRRTDYVVNIDPASAESDAHIAANLSYYRAHIRHDHYIAKGFRDGPPGSPLRRSNTVNGRLESPPNGIPKRKQSIRFTGPNARPQRQLAARAKPVVRTSRPKSTDTVKSHEATQRFPGCSNYEQSIDMSRISQNSSTSALSRGATYLTDPIGITPVRPFLGSLRKSKSMYSQSTVSVPGYHEHSFIDKLKPLPLTPSTAQSRNGQNEADLYSIRRSLRAPKSMSYLDFRSTKSVAGELENTQTEFHPRDKVTQSKGSFRRLKSHSSMFFRSKQRRQDCSIGLSSSLRNSSDNSAAVSSAFSGKTTPAPRHTGIRFTARRVSKTVRNKLSRLFGRSKSTDTSRNEMGANVPRDTDSDSFRHLTDSPPIEEVSMSRVASHVPSIHAVPSCQQMQSRQGSLESVPPEEENQADYKSRVTSWTNSTANTVLSYGFNDVAEHEYQRLSVIRENGMHVPSSSRTSPIQDWQPTTTYAPAVPGMTINSQRVYSALMKKLAHTPDTTERAQAHEPTSQLPEDSVPPRQSSLEQVGSQPWSPTTIRCIGTSEDDVFEDTKEVASLKHASESGSDDKYGESCSRVPGKRPYKAYPNATAGDGKGLSPDKTAGLPPSSSGRASLRTDRNSTFSPSLDNHFFRATSPYRRAIQQSMKEHQEPGHTHALDTRYLSTLSALSLPTRRPSTVGSERDMRLTYAESFYSFTTEELTTTRPDGTATSPTADNKRSAAAAMSTPVGQVADVATPIQGRDVSAGSSVEWKTWLSADISKLGKPSVATAQSPHIEQPNNTSQSVGHVRESAEIESPGETPKTAPTSVGGEGIGEALSPPSIGTRTSSIRTGSPLKSAERAAQASDPSKGDEIQSPASSTAPPIPYRHALRPTTNVPEVDDNTSPISIQCPPGLLQMRSLNTAPTVAPQDGLTWKGCEQENTRAGSLTESKSISGLTSAIQRPAGRKLSPPGNFISGASTCPHMSERQAPLPNGLSESTKSEWDAQIKGSRRMVDLFLSSRRKAIQGTMSRNTSENYSTAFL